MRPDERALLNAVLAEPDDDTPRLIYADWLDEHGRSERAGFIRYQLHFRFEGRLIGHTADVMTKAERGPLPPLPLPGLTFRRGFVESVTLSVEDWMRHADAILSSQPVTEVTLNPAPGLWADLADGLYTLNPAPGLWADLADGLYTLTFGQAEVGYRIPDLPPPSDPEATRIILGVLWPRVKTWHLSPA